MNYFTALLLAAGLPTSMTVIPSVVSPAVTHEVSAPSVSSVMWAPSGGVATVSQAYQTLNATHQYPTRVSTPATRPSIKVSSTGSTTQGGSSSTTATSGTTDGANTMITLINQARVKAGLAPYAVNSKLMKLAQERAQVLAGGSFTSDMTPYGWPAQMEQKAGISAQGLGAENIAEASSVQQAFAMLMASAPHRANILNPYETQIGVGVSPWGSGVAISELFIGPNT